jgi:hypothetical protein
MIARPDTPKMSVITTDIFSRASSSSFSTRWRTRVRSATRSNRSRVQSRTWRIGSAGTKLRRTMFFSFSLHSHTASSLSLLGLPGTFLTSRAFTSQHSSPADDSR